MIFKYKMKAALENEVCKEYDYLMRVATELILQHQGYPSISTP